MARSRQLRCNILTPELKQGRGKKMGVALPDTVELRGFMQLESLFKKRGWLNPHLFKLDRRVTGPELLVRLDVPPEEVEVIFVNRTAFAMHLAVVQPGDRVALVPPGVPGPHRLLLGFKNTEVEPD